MQQKKYLLGLKLSVYWTIGISASSSLSLISIYLGVYDIQNGTVEFKIEFWGVTPQAQNTFNSSSSKGLGELLQAGSAILIMPISFGLPTCIGLPWSQWKHSQISITLLIWSF